MLRPTRPYTIHNISIQFFFIRGFFLNLQMILLKEKKGENLARGVLD
jgi:hypothetical protein